MNKEEKVKPITNEYEVLQMIRVGNSLNYSS